MGQTHLLPVNITVVLPDVILTLLSPLFCLLAYLVCHVTYLEIATTYTTQWRIKCPQTIAEKLESWKRPPTQSSLEYFMRISVSASCLAITPPRLLLSNYMLQKDHKSIKYEIASSTHSFHHTFSGNTSYSLEDATCCSSPFLHRLTDYE